VIYEESITLLSKDLEIGRKKPRVETDFLCSNEHSLLFGEGNMEDE
jgi:hypothetical protein